MGARLNWPVLVTVMRGQEKRPPYSRWPSSESDSSLLLIALLGLRDARILCVTGHSVALFFRDLVLRFHLVFGLFGFCLRFGLVRLRIGFGLRVIGLGLLHAHILVIAGQRLAL